MVAVLTALRGLRLRPGPALRPSDALLLPTALVLEVVVFSTFLSAATAADPGARATIVGYALAETLLLVLRRVAPLPVFAGVWIVAVAARLALASAHPFVALVVALEAVAQRCRLWVSVAAAAAALVPVGIEASAAVRAAPTDRPGTLIATVAVYVLVIGAAWGLGRWRGRTDRRFRDLDERRRRAAEAAVALERTRIARELHDIVSHAVTVMVLHAAGANRVLATDPDRARLAMTTVEQAGTQAIGELRRLLGLLRDSGVVSGDTVVPVGLEQLDALLGEIRSAGVTVGLAVTGTPSTLDPSVDATAYRVVEEALTNVARHGGPGTAATLRLGWAPRTLAVEVDDDGAGTPQDGDLSTGNGLTGLRERLAVVGGALSARPDGDGGFRVRALLPVTDEAPPAVDRAPLAAAVAE